MVYNPNIPQAGDLLSVSQNDILINFQQLNIQFGSDHYPINFAGGAAAPYDIAVAGDKGKHKQVTLVRVSADVATGANEVAVFSKNTAAGVQELFMRRPSDGTVVQITSGNPTVAGNGFTYLPGGVLFQWGLGTFGNGNNTVTIVFPTIFRAATTPFNVQGTRISSDPDNRTLMVNPGTATNTQVGFIRRHSSDNHTFYWNAIGQAP